ncbi:hypothetical protein ACHAO4_004471 [Trichoderma viride]
MSDHIFENAGVNAPVPPTLSRIYYGSTDREGDALSFVRFLGVFGRPPLYYSDISVWSDPGSSAAVSGNICTLPQLATDNGPEAFAYINSLLKTCLQEHESCKRTMAKALVNETSGPQLPTRVLDVGEINGEHIHLVETNGRHGDFCALSYCWGPKGTQTMITTRDNINDRFNGIRFAELPKTFQDVVIVTREIGIRHLWIDSLCIIQGDRQDWANEAGKMADVYQRAHLVIAASGAENPEVGCFSKKRRCPYGVQVPYYAEDGQVDGFMQLSVPVQGESASFWGPLSKRGWTLQEQHLARRILYFMPAGITWKCNMLMTSERTTALLEDFEGWTDLLQKYSARQLTYKEDRLAAIEGLGQAIQETSHDKYNRGIFESTIPEQLLFMMEHRADKSDRLDTLPSWHWASKGGPKLFWRTQGAAWRKLHEQISTEPSGILKVQGFIAKCKILRTRPSQVDPAEDQVFSHLQSTIQQSREDPLRWIQTSSRPARLAGIAILDDEHFASAYLLFLVQWEDYGK